MCNSGHPSPEDTCANPKTDNKNLGKKDDHYHANLKISQKISTQNLSIQQTVPPQDV